jgi:fermentation-respiration switch protein FrsA (DUF1100 family)
MAQKEAVRRESMDFESEGTRCAAWLYRPDESASAATGDPPVVVMAHGFGLPRRFELPAFAERGLAVLVFDYRSLGDSGGEPRNVGCPALVVEGAGDQIAPKGAIDGTVSKLPDVNWVSYDTDYFGAFFGDLFEEVVDREGAFFERHLLDGDEP